MTAPGRRRRRRHLRPARGLRAAPGRPRDDRLRGGRTTPAATRTRSRSRPTTARSTVDTGFIVLNDRNYPNFERPARRARRRDPAREHELRRLRRPRRVRVGGARRRAASSPAPPTSSIRASSACSPTSSASTARRGAWSGPTATGPSLRDVPRRRRLLRLLRRAPARPPGRGRLVGRPGPDVELPGLVPRRVLRQPRRAADPQPAALALDRRRLEALRRGADAPFARADPALDPGAAHRPRAPAAMASIVIDDGAAERFDEVVIAAHSDQALAMLGARPRRPSARCSARSPTRRTRPSCTPTRACCRGAAAPGPAGTTTCSTTRPATSTVTYDMNRLQSLGPRERFLVTLNRTEAIDPAKIIRVIDYAHPVYTNAGHGGAGVAGPRSAAPTGSTSAAPTGAGASTRTAPGRRCASPRRSAGAGPVEPAGERAASSDAALSEDRSWSRREPRAGRSRGPLAAARGTSEPARPGSAIYEGWVAHRRQRAGRARVPLPDLPAALRPRRAPGAARRRPALVGARRRAPARFRRSDYLGDPAAAARRRRPRPRRRAHRPPPRPARCGCSPTRATGASASTRSPSTTSTATAPRVCRR